MPSHLDNRTPRLLCRKTSVPCMVRLLCKCVPCPVWIEDSCRNFCSITARTLVSLHMCYVIYVDIVDEVLEARQYPAGMCCQLGVDIGRYCALEVLSGTNWGVISRYSALFGVLGALLGGSLPQHRRYSAIFCVKSALWDKLMRYWVLFCVIGAIPGGFWIGLYQGAADIERYWALKVLSGTDSGVIRRYSALFLIGSTHGCSEPCGTPDPGTQPKGPHMKPLPNLLCQGSKKSSDFVEKEVQKALRAAGVPVSGRTGLWIDGCVRQTLGFGVSVRLP